MRIAVGILAILLLWWAGSALSGDVKFEPGGDGEPRRDAADCTAELGGATGEICVDNDGTGLYFCPSPGDCSSTTAWVRKDDTAGGGGADGVGTNELDDGVHVPGSGEYVRVDTVDQAGIEYRSTAEVLSDIGAQASDAELTTIAGLTETNGNVMIVDSGAWASIAQPVIDCTNCTDLPVGSHTGTIAWGGTAILNHGLTFQFGDGGDVSLTHTFGHDGATDPQIVYDNDSIAITNAATFTNGGNAILDVTSTSAGITTLTGTTLTLGDGGDFTALKADAGGTDPTFTFGNNSIAITNAATFTKAGNAILDTTSTSAGITTLTGTTLRLGDGGDFTAITVDAGATDPVLTFGSDSLALTNVGTFTAEGDRILTVGNALLTDINDPSGDTTFVLGDGEEINWVITTKGDTDPKTFHINFDQEDDGDGNDLIDVFHISIQNETGLVDTGDTLEGIVVRYESNTPGSVLDAGITFRNAEATTAVVTDAFLVIDTTGTGDSITDAFDASDADIVNALNMGLNKLVTTNCTIGDDGTGMDFSCPIAITGAFSATGVSTLTGETDLGTSPTAFSNTSITFQLDEDNNGTESVIIQDGGDLAIFTFQEDGVLLHGQSVNDDVCDTAGEWWYDTTDTRFEFCEASSGAPFTLGALDSTLVDATTWSDGSNASNIWTFDVSGTNHTMTAGSALMTFSGAVTTTGALTSGSTSGDGSLVLHDDDAGGDATVTITVTDGTATNYTLNLPPDNGDAGEVLQTDGNGALTWEADATAGNPTWNSLLVPTDNQSLAMDADTTTFAWSQASDSALDAWTMSYTHTAAASTTNQTLLTLQIPNSGGDDGDVDAVLHIEHLDTGDALNKGILIEAAAGTINTAIDLDDAEIDIAISIGSNDVTVGGATISSAEFAALDASIDLTSEITGTLPVANGGTGAVALTDGGILLGSDTGAITALGAAANGQIPIGDGTTDPVLAEITGGRSITSTSGAGTITIIADVETYTDTKCIIIETPTSADNFLWFRANAALTITDIDCISEDATSTTIEVEECDADGDNCGVSEAVVCAVTNTADDGIDDAAIDATDWLRLDVTATDGTPGHVTVCTTFTWDD